ncbi:MAG TPA: redoxin domain-containing protein [Polyangiaceae bacterium]|nr:redoxin domain-containing protein [Polyangiaceae bacterium]
MGRRIEGVALLLAAEACAWGSRAAAPGATPPIWDRPGLGGAVRPAMGSPQPGEPAPPLSLPDLEGNVVSLDSMRGSWVLLHFTASWCPFCDAEIEHLGSIADAFAPRAVKIVVVDVEEDARAWRAYASQRVAPSVVALHDPTGAAAARFAPPGAQPSFDDRAQAVLDATLLVDETGVIRLFLLPDSAHFDPTFGAVRAELDRLASRPVVGVAAERRTIAAGEGADVVVRLDVAAGYHVMSDRPSEPTYIPTHVEIEPSPDVGVGGARYPSPVPYALGDRTIATFQGAVEVRFPVDVARGAAPGPRRLRGSVHYQACTASRCLFPVRRPFEVPVVIGRP